jgi:hypothetical protein
MKKKIFLALFLFFQTSNCFACENFIENNNQKIFLKNIKLKKSFCKKAKEIYPKNEIILKNCESDRFSDKYCLVFEKCEKKESINEKILKNGYGFLYPMSSNKILDKALKKSEKNARVNKNGLWKDKNFIKNEKNISKFINSYQLVKTKVEKVHKNKYGIYINTGKNWKKDFSVFIDKDLIEKIGFSPKSKQNIIVRGWVKSYNGPMIDIVFPSQIELIKK